MIPNLWVSWDPHPPQPNDRRFRMSDEPVERQITDPDPQETQEWLESLDYALDKHGPDRVRFLLNRLQAHASQTHVDLEFDLIPHLGRLWPLDFQANTGCRNFRLGTGFRFQLVCIRRNLEAKFRIPPLL